MGLDRSVFGYLQHYVDHIAPFIYNMVPQISRYYDTIMFCRLFYCCRILESGSFLKERKMIFVWLVFAKFSARYRITTLGSVYCTITASAWFHFEMFFPVNIVRLVLSAMIWPILQYRVLHSCIPVIVPTFIELLRCFMRCFIIHTWDC